jgi:mannose-6-phosphate isomerase-like protein (cupin superfamily)
VRKLITGVDAGGRSCLLEESEVAPAPVGGHGVSVARVFATNESPPAARPPGLGDTVDVRLPPGFLRWMAVEHRPYEEVTRNGSVTSTTMHHSDALDLVFVQEGTAELVLQDGAHAVAAGDFVVTPGVDHAWRAGPDGCRFVVVSVGMPPPAVTA